MLMEYKNEATYYQLVRLFPTISTKAHKYKEN